MTGTDDDDLPVLTQVLRTGDGRLPPPDEVGARDVPAPSTDLHRIGSYDAGGADPSGARALVIGSDQEAHDGETADVWRDASSIRRSAAPTADSTDRGPAPSVVEPDAPIDSPFADVGNHDVFLRSAPLDAAYFDAIDEPPLVDRFGDPGDTGDTGDGDGAGTTGAAALSALSRDVPLVFGGRPAIATRDLDASFAQQVRDSVLQELSARIDTELDARIAQTLHAALESALGHLQGSLRVELAEALRDVVGHAVDDAVRRLRQAAPTDHGT